MSPIGVSPILLPAATRPPEKIRDAASQFEALLIGQILRSARDGSSEDPASDCATDFAEQQLANTMAKAGGLGIADLVARGLK
jgi:peptidoglycan hydrolase FlgJ